MNKCKRVFKIFLSVVLVTGMILNSKVMSKADSSDSDIIYSEEELNVINEKIERLKERRQQYILLNNQKMVEEINIELEKLGVKQVDSGDVIGFTSQLKNSDGNTDKKADDIASMMLPDNPVNNGKAQWDKRTYNYAYQGKIYSIVEYTEYGDNSVDSKYFVSSGAKLKLR